MATFPVFLVMQYSQNVARDVILSAHGTREAAEIAVKNENARIDDLLNGWINAGVEYPYVEEIEVQVDLPVPGTP